jgi:hypothetical protein
MYKYTKYFLAKMEHLFEELGYEIRYERGSFQSGYCIVRQQRVAVINKFFDTEARINTLLEILDTLDVTRETLSPSGQLTFDKIRSVLNTDNATTQ